MGQAFSVASILDSIKDTIGSISEEEMKADGNYKATGEILKAEQTAQEQAARDASTVKAAEQAGILQQQARISKVMEAMDWDAMSVELATKMRDSGSKLEALQAQISKKNEVGFLDNPLAWIGAQMSVQPDIEAYNAEADKFNLLETHSTAVNNMAQEVANTARAALSTVTEDSAAAAANLAGLQFGTQAREAQIKALANDTGRLRYLRESNLAQISLETEGRRTLDAAEDQQRQREAFAMQKESHKLAMENARREAAKNKKEDEFDVKMLEMINAGARHLNRRPFTSMDDYKLFEKSNKGNAEIAQRLSNIGYNLINTATTNGGAGRVQLGQDAGEVAQLLVESRGTLKQAPAVDRLLKGVYIDAKSGKAVSGGAMLDVKNPAAVNAHVANVVASVAKSQARDVNSGGKDNIYAPPTYAEVIAARGEDGTKMPALYYKLFAEEVKQNPMQPVDPAKMYHRTLEAVASGKVSFNEAVNGLSEMGALAVQTNNAIRNYSAAGIPEQRSYSTKTKLSEYNFWETDIDLTNRAELAHKLARSLPARRAMSPDVVNTVNVFKNMQQNQGVK